jgi:hypothetical protein
MKTKKISIDLVFNANGSLNEEETLTSAKQCIQNWSTTNGTIKNDIVEAIHNVFNTLATQKIQNVNTLYVVNEALRTLQYDPGDYNLYVEQAQNYLRRNTGPRESGALFQSKKGKKGGIWRWADKPEEG